ncbi:MAG: hypothetical protein EBV69_03745 [Oxalobacteraceae bacterium]|nr:hypothetical protein [Oxalobacteraceae bacterium]
MASSISHRLGTLQGFQQQLAERLQRAQQSYRSTQSYLAIRVSQMIGVIDRAQLKPEAPAVTPSIWAPTRFVHADGSHYIGIDLIKLMALPAFLDIARYPA